MFIKKFDEREWVKKERRGGGAGHSYKTKFYVVVVDESSFLTL